MDSVEKLPPSTPLRFQVATGLSTLALLVALIPGWFCWILRDGLGPDSVTSSGWFAWRCFLGDFWPFGAVSLLLLFIAFALTRRRSIA
jgi:hypothetical protein